MSIYRSIYTNPSEVNFTPVFFSQCFVKNIPEILNSENVNKRKFDDEKKKRLIKLICKVQGKTITEEKEIQEYKITVSDVKMLAKEVLGIEIMTENIKF